MVEEDIDNILNSALAHLLWRYLQGTERNIFIAMSIICIIFLTELLFCITKYLLELIGAHYYLYY